MCRKAATGQVCRKAAARTKTGLNQLDQLIQLFYMFNIPVKQEYMKSSIINHVEQKASNLYNIYHTCMHL